VDIYGLDVKDRMRSKNQSKNLDHTISRPSARGYGAYDR
jgi:hypothetical protein